MDEEQTIAVLAALAQPTRLRTFRLLVEREPAGVPAGELARLVDGDDVGSWARAAEAWDALHRPHDSAYCRWRGAQAALRAGRGTVAVRLLTRAAREACDHVPLGKAIATTAAGTR